MEKDLQTLTRLLSKGQTQLQLAMALTLWCDHPRIDYLLQNVMPEFTKEAAARVDAAILKAMDTITDQNLSDMPEETLLSRYHPTKDRATSTHVWRRNSI